jgi:hypothetical protein
MHVSKNVKNYCYLEDISQARKLIFFHLYLGSSTDVIHITLLILGLFDMNLVSLSSRKGVLSYNVIVLPTIKTTNFISIFKTGGHLILS